MYISNEQADSIKALTEQLERRTGVELVAMIVDKCDTYPEIPWKAFAFTASISVFCLLLQAFIRPSWIIADREIFMALTILGTGAAAALLTLFWPFFARLFLDDIRATGETEQYARSQFLEREIFRTQERSGILLLVSLFERKVVILPDKGIQHRMAQETLANVIAQMTEPLHYGKFFEALRDGLAALEESLTKAGFKGSPGAPDQISDELIQQKGTT